jgi:hypothetical protein
MPHNDFIKSQFNLQSVEFDNCGAILITSTAETILIVDTGNVSSAIAA